MRLLRLLLSRAPRDMGEFVEVQIGIVFTLHLLHALDPVLSLHVANGLCKEV